MHPRNGTPAASPSRVAVSRPFVVVGAVLGGILPWASWPLLCDIVARWRHNPQNNHAFLVPLFAGVLLWLCRKQVSPETWQPSWWGVLILAAGAVFHDVAGWLVMPLALLLLGLELTLLSRLVVEEKPPALLVVVPVRGATASAHAASSA